MTKPKYRYFFSKYGGFLRRVSGEKIEIFHPDKKIWQDSVLEINRFLLNHADTEVTFEDDGNVTTIEKFIETLKKAKI